MMVGRRRVAWGMAGTCKSRATIALRPRDGKDKARRCDASGRAGVAGAQGPGLTDRLLTPRATTPILAVAWNVPGTFQERSNIVRRCSTRPDRHARPPAPSIARPRCEGHLPPGHPPHAASLRASRPPRTQRTRPIRPIAVLIPFGLGGLLMQRWVLIPVVA